jgi:hypothetical protein
VPNNDYGYATVVGQVHNLDTSLWIAGTKLYLSDTEAGGLTNIAPTISVPVATVVHSSATIGSIFIKVNETVDQLGDMLKADYDSNLNSIVDKAEALNDGTTGDGNNVTAQEARDHIDDISNPHNVTKAQLGFPGDPSDIGCSTGITASDIDDAVVKKHAHNYYYGESLSSSSSTSTYSSYVNKLTLSIPTPVAGDYILMWSCEIANSTAWEETWLRVRDGSTTYAEARIVCGVTYANSGWIFNSGQIKVTLSSAVNYYIDFCRATGGNTAYIKNARISLRRLI